MDPQHFLVLLKGGFSVSSSKAWLHCVTKNQGINSPPDLLDWKANITSSSVLDVWEFSSLQTRLHP